MLSFQNADAILCGTLTCLPPRHSHCTSHIPLCYCQTFNATHLQMRFAITDNLDPRYCDNKLWLRIAICDKPLTLQFATSQIKNHKSYPMFLILYARLWFAIGPTSTYHITCFYRQSLRYLPPFLLHVASMSTQKVWQLIHSAITPLSHHILTRLSLHKFTFLHRMLYKWEFQKKQSRFLVKCDNPLTPPLSFSHGLNYHIFWINYNIYYII